MKKTKFLWALLMTAAMLFVFMPAAAFAGSGDSASFEFNGDANYYYGGSWIDYEKEGNSITISYPDKDPETYICKSFDRYGDGNLYYEFFLNGEVTKYPNGEYKYVSLELDNSDAVYNNDTTDAEATVYGPLEESGEGSWGALAKGTIHAKAYPKPVSVSYEGAELTYYAGSSSVNHFFEPGNKLTLTFSDGSSQVYIYKEFYDGEEYLGGGYYLNGEPPVGENGEIDYWGGEYVYLDSPEDGFASGTTETDIVFHTEYAYQYISVTGKASIEMIPVIESFEYAGDPLYYYDDSKGLFNLDHPGNVIIANMSNGKTLNYIYTKFEVTDAEGDTYTDGAYFVDGKVTFDEDGYPKNHIRPYARYIGEDKAKIYLGDEEDGLYTIVPAVQAPKPVRLEYEGCELQYHPEGTGLDNLYTPDNKITVVFDDGSTKEFICKQYEDDGMSMTGYFLDGEVYFNGLYYETRNIEVAAPSGGFKPGTKNATVTTDWTYGYEDLTVKGSFPVKPAPKPVSVEFIPGKEGFVAEGLIGKTSADERNFNGDGNKFVVHYADGTSKEYIYLPDTKENTGGFNLNGDYYESNFAMNANIPNGIKKGTNNVTFKYSDLVEIDGKAKKVVLNVVLPLKATKKYVYLEFTKSAVYTGKALKPAGRLCLYNGTVLSSTYFTVAYPTAIKVGSYKATPKIKAAYANTYGTDDESFGIFKIVPKGTTLSKVTAGKKSFTATWKKQATQTTGYQIQCATNSKFTTGKKLVTITKTGTLKTTVKSLKAKKKYFVRVRTYKTVSGVKYFSAWSKYKTVTTK